MLNEQPYIEFVMKEAEAKGKLFILDSGEGRDCVDDETGWYIEDLSGWLIPQAEHGRFMESRKNNTVYKDFSDEYVFAIWSRDAVGRLEITFKKY